MTRARPALACLALVLLAACNREPASEPVAEPAATTATDTPAATAPAPATDAVAVTPTAVPSAEAPTFDARAFAGTFGDGTDRLELRPDGTYAMSSGGASIDGTWAAEEKDTRIRLDPNSKSEPDRVFAMQGRDGLVALGPDGRPAAADAAMTLRREDAAAPR